MVEGANSLRPVRKELLELLKAADSRLQQLSQIQRRLMHIATELRVDELTRRVALSAAQQLGPAAAAARATGPGLQLLENELDEPGPEDS